MVSLLCGDSKRYRLARLTVFPKFYSDMLKTAKSHCNLFKLHFCPSYVLLLRYNHINMRGFSNNQAAGLISLTHRPARSVPIDEKRQRNSPCPEKTDICLWTLVES